MPKQTPRKLVLWPIVLSVYLGGFLTYSVVPLGRLATTYSALDIGTSKQVIALLSAVFALLPACMTMLVGRLNSQGRYGLVATCGALAILSACLILYALPVSLGVFLCGTGLLGIGQTCCLTALQIVLFRSSTRQHRDGLLGNFMVVMSLGQVTAPLMIGLPVERQTLFAIAACGAVVLVAASLFMGRLVTVDKRTEGTSKVSLRDITHTPGLPWIIVIGSICVAAQDIVLTFLPVLGIERGIPEATIGLLLSVRAMAAMFSRAIFGQAVRRFGRMPLLLFSSGMAGLAFLALMLPLPVMLLGLALAINGFGLAVSITGSVALTVEIAPKAARATALSMRLSIMRLTQFFVPFAASALVAPLGVTGIFGFAGAALLGAVAVRPRRTGN